MEQNKKVLTSPSSPTRVKCGLILAVLISRAADGGRFHEMMEVSLEQKGENSNKHLCGFVIDWTYCES